MISGRTGENGKEPDREECIRAWSELGIPEEAIAACTMPFHSAPASLVSAGPDIFNREQFVTARTLDCWRKMQLAASKDHIVLTIVSAYRSFEYQCGIIRRKLDMGESIGSILKVNAIPGFSEHHSGRAIDIGTPDCEPLSGEFEHTPAFKWLDRHAATFDFELSYPRDNPYGINFEPWHWSCRLPE